MQLQLTDIIPILNSTPAVLQSLLENLPDHLARADEGEGTWSPHRVMEPLIHGETTDWISRMEIILTEGESRSFAPFDRTGFKSDAPSQTLQELLELFASLRERNVAILRAKDLTEADLQRTGVHPALGRVTLSQLLASWAVHDLGHIRQIVRSIAYQYRLEVGPWKEYLSIVKK